jgi:6-phosphogluconolactonase/glucosamine-6-phosphate isomerase/deaminase
MNADLQATYIAPDTKYFKTKEDFDKAVSKDFVAHANQTLISGKKFLVGLSHGQSPAGAYQLIVQYFSKIKNKKNIYFTFVNSPLKTQENLTDVFTASQFLKKLVREGLITTEQVLGRNIHQEILDEDADGFNFEINNFLKENKKTGLDYVFLATNSKGRIAGIERKSKAFDSTDIATIVTINKERELTLTPSFLMQSKRIAFLATKSEKRRPLAWLYSTTGKENESPSFLRHINNVKERVTVFIDDKALTWPELEIKRETPYGVLAI